MDGDEQKKRCGTSIRREEEGEESERATSEQHFKREKED